MTRWLAMLVGGLGACLRGRMPGRRRKAPTQKAQPRKRRRRRTSFRFTSIWRKASPTPAAKAAANGSRSRAASTPVRPVARRPSSSAMPRASCRSISIRRAAAGRTRSRSAANCDSCGITVGVGATVPRGCASARDTAAACARGEAVAAAGRWRNGVPTPLATPPACGRCSAARSGTCRRRPALASIPAR